VLANLARKGDGGERNHANGARIALAPRQRGEGSERSERVRGAKRIKGLHENRVAPIVV
jgi:hypothetical protein